MTYHAEDANENTPMLGESSSAPNSRRPQQSPIFRFLHFFGGGIYAPDSSTYDPIEILLNVEHAEERDRLTERWRDNKLSELSFVGVVAALLTGVLTSTGSWPDILPSGHQSPWPVRTCWYCGIILSLCSILSAADQTVRLHRMSSHRDAWKNIRNLLGKKHGRPNRSSKTGRLKPNTWQLYTWQMPVMFLTTATVSMIVGMFLHVWSATRYLDHDDWLDSDAKVAITFSVVAVVSITIFVLGQVTLYTTGDDLE
ncbi:hypothetical protein CC78DRAFT_561815 [Lojkania enalia]|uniref:Uncharacterized protein n=1 Tax=Lojkania enalia TaxID=147567 RepID=A0A9P4N1A8_9PLEO|nr:hypothetical protein CC78DRAFT_561815 [Didymosphaeria enalia]